LQIHLLDGGSVVKTEQIMNAGEVNLETTVTIELVGNTPKLVFARNDLDAPVNFGREFVDT